MDIFKISAFAIVAAVIILTIKGHRPEIALAISIVSGLLIFSIVFSKIGAVMSFMFDFGTKLKIDSSYISILIKIIGIAYISEFTVDILKDAGQAALASRLELAGKVLIIIMAVPIFTSLFDLISGIL